MLNASRRAFAAASLVGLISFPALAETGAAEKAAAEALFDEGLRFMKSGEYTSACPKLESSQRIDPAVGTLLYLGECYERLGRTASAWATFREAASTARAAGQADRAKTAQARAERLQPELAYLTLEVSPETRKISGLLVRRSGTPVAPDLFGVASPADPGEIEIEASAPGYATFVTRTAVVARGTSRIQIPALAKKPEAVAASDQGLASTPSVTVSTLSAPVASSDAALGPLRDDPLRPLAYVLGAVGIAGMGIGSYFGLRAISKNSDAEEICPNTQCQDQTGLTLTDQAKDAALVSNVAFGVGATALAAGIVVFALTPASRETALRVTPFFSSDGAGIGLQGQL